MLGQPNLLSLDDNIDLWAQQEARLLELFSLALKLLQNESFPRLLTKAYIDEEDINRELFRCLHSVNFSLPAEKRFDHLPISDCKNQPNQEDDFRDVREWKEPDFQWEFIDHSAKSYRFYTIECKRLGSPTSATHILNREYIVNGIRRFQSKEHGYGKSSSSGAMIGYIEDLEFEDIQTEVNKVAKEENIPAMVLSDDGWQKDGVSRLNHIFTRSFRISPFALTHMWAVLGLYYVDKDTAAKRKRPARPLKVKSKK